MAIDVGTPGNSIDITTSEFHFDGQTLSAAVESLKWTTKQDEEVTHFQGLEDPQERNAGQRTHEGTMIWGHRQFMLFCNVFGGRDAASKRIFTLTILGRPENDPKIYEMTFNEFRILGDSGGFDKGASKIEVPFSFLSREWVVSNA